jgi:hypothetical protein
VFNAFAIGFAFSLKPGAGSQQRALRVIRAIRAVRVVCCCFPLRTFAAASSQLSAYQRRSFSTLSAVSKFS